MPFFQYAADAERAVDVKSHGTRLQKDSILKFSAFCGYGFIVFHILSLLLKRYTESMTAEISLVTCTNCGNRPVKEPGYRLCGMCIGALKRKNDRPAVRRNAVQMDAEIQSRRILRELIEANGINIEVREWDEDFNPFEALLNMAQELTTWKDICLAKVAKIHEDEWRWDGDRAGEQMRSEIALYERAAKQASDLLIKIARLGIEERMMRIAERQATIVEQAIVRTIQDLDLPVDMQAKARSKIIQHLKSS